jgi:hypothetical protein
VSPESLLAQLRATVGRRKTPPTAKPIVMLNNTVCYSGDIRRPLGINRMLPEDTVVEVADNRLERRYNGSGWPIQRRFAPSGPLQTMSPPPASAWPSPGRQRRGSRNDAQPPCRTTGAVLPSPRQLDTYRCRPSNEAFNRRLTLPSQSAVRAPEPRCPSDGAGPGRSDPWPCGQYQAQPPRAPRPVGERCCRRWERE